MKYIYFIVLLFFTIQGAYSQRVIEGRVTGGGESLAFANVHDLTNGSAYITTENGDFTIEGSLSDSILLSVSYLGFKTSEVAIIFSDNSHIFLDISLQTDTDLLDEVVISGTMREVSRSSSPVPVEVYRPAFFRKNPTPNVYEALQNVNGVRPQLNCNVCNTGDIHINGLEGPYTMVLIDGMPIVSSLATVYGLSGIPNSLIERMEIVKGPASSLYGSEAIGGLINIITKSPARAPLFSADFMRSSWNENNIDLGFSTGIGDKLSVLNGINFFHYQNPIDHNGDNFTDVTLQERVSVFQKWNYKRANQKIASLAARYYEENRWGGEMDWNPSHKGGDEVYGESIMTRRWEMIGKYTFSFLDDALLSFSYNDHQQESYYGEMPFIADQKIGFAQLTWNRGNDFHHWLIGATGRYTYYDDDTPATREGGVGSANLADKILIPGILTQYEQKWSGDKTLLLGARIDHHDNHGMIFTPRVAFKTNLAKNHILRLNLGTGFRVVNLFTEDHAALTGARDVIIPEALKPEKSFNVNLNYAYQKYFQNGSALHVDLSGWYTHFSNLILPDYESNPNQIIYDNIEGHALSRGMSADLNLSLASGIDARWGVSILDVASVEGGIKTRPLLTESWSSTWSVTLPLYKRKLNMDYTGNVYGPMSLPTLGPLDPRSKTSPIWSIQNLQWRYSLGTGTELYSGIKNLLNWTPANNNPHLIARAHDPFDRQVQFSNDGSVIPTSENPYALTFDPTYVFAPNQGRRFYLGMRYTLH